MLNYNEDNPTCINLLKKRGQNVSDKNLIKALSTMTGAQAQMNDKLASFQGCILPNESMKTLNISVTNNRCILPNIQNDYNLVYTSDGILSMNPQVQEKQIQKGEGIYPSKGCLHNFDNGNTNGLIDNVSNVIDFNNKQELDRLRSIIENLQSDCNDLDRLIDNERTNLTNAINKLNTQINVCKQYKTDLNYYNNLTTDIKNNIVTETNNLNIATSRYQESVKSGQRMVEKCNNDIKHCFAYQHCDYSGNRQKLEGYIGNLETYGFNAISSIQIPPGIEVRIFDDFEYVGGDSKLTAPLISKGLDKRCLTDDEYTQTVKNRDNVLGGITMVTTKRNWNDNIRSIRIRRAEEYSFTPASVIETFENYNDTVKAPLTHLETPGNIDNYFYADVNLTVKNIGKDYMNNYKLYDNKDILGGTLTNHITISDYDPNAQDKKLYNDNELNGIPVQRCAKTCTDNKSKCDAFIYKPNDKTCDSYKKDPNNPFVIASTNNCGNGGGTCKSYISKTLLDNTDIINPPPLPDGPYKKTCDTNLGTYKKGILNTTCNEKFTNSSIKVDDCIANTIRSDGNNKLSCDKKPIPACQKPNNWCNGNLSASVTVDCIGDGIAGDHLCKEVKDGKFSNKSILRANDCQAKEGAEAKNNSCVNEWNNIKAPVCQKPEGWCVHAGARYANIDCLGTGDKGDYICADSDGQSGSIFRANNCNGTWPKDPQKACPIEWDKLKKSLPTDCIVDTWENQWGGATGARFIMSAKEDNKVFTNTDGGWSWVIGAATSMRLYSNNFKVILEDDSKNKIEVKQDTPWLMDLRYLPQGNWNDRIRKMTFVRL